MDIAKWWFKIASSLFEHFGGYNESVAILMTLIQIDSKMSKYLYRELSTIAAKLQHNKFIVHRTKYILLIN